MPAEPPGDRARGPGAEERIQHHVAGMAGGDDHPVEQGLGLLGRMQLAAVGRLEPFRPVADRQGPVATHLQALVERLHRLIVEGRLRGDRGARPDQGLVGVGEAGALEVRHRVGLDPDDVVLDPEPEILQHRADAEDVVVAADHPQRAVGLEDPLALAQPGPGKRVVRRKAVEPVPVVVDTVHAAVVGPIERARQLEIVRRVSEYEVDRSRWQSGQPVQAIADQDFVER